MLVLVGVHVTPILRIAWGQEQTDRQMDKRTEDRLTLEGYFAPGLPIVPVGLLNALNVSRRLFNAEELDFGKT